MTKTLLVLRQILRALPFVALLLAVLTNEAMAESSTAASSSVVVDKVRAFRDGDVFTAEIQTSNAWNGADVQVKYMKDFIQAEVTGATLTHGKELIKVEDRIFKSVYATQNEPETMRVRFYVKPGTIAKTLAGRFHARRGNSAITFEVTGDTGDAALAKTVKDDAQTIAVVDESGASDTINSKLVAGNDNKNANKDENKNETASATTRAANSALAAQTNDSKIDQKNDQQAEAKADANEATAITASASTNEKKLDTNKLPESQIPVLATTKESKKSEGSPIFRIIMTLAVAAVTLGAAAYGMKKMAGRNGSKTQNARIKVLTSHHLGPKKNLTIVQVAGETILIGVTDHSITMLKTLSLLDEEIPEAGPQRFNQAMGDFAELDEDEPIALRGLDQIRDTVSARLKNMRNL